MLKMYKTWINTLSIIKGFLRVLKLLYNTMIFKMIVLFKGLLYKGFQKPQYNTMILEISTIGSLSPLSLYIYKELVRAV